MPQATESPCPRDPVAISNEVTLIATVREFSLYKVQNIKLVQHDLLTKQFCHLKSACGYQDEILILINGKIIQKKLMQLKHMKKGAHFCLHGHCLLNLF